MQEVVSGASRCPEPLQVCTEKFIYRSFDKNEQYPIYCIYCFIINCGLYIAFCKPAVVPWCANSHGGGRENLFWELFFFSFFLSFFLFCFFFTLGFSLLLLLLFFVGRTHPKIQVCIKKK